MTNKEAIRILQFCMPMDTEKKRQALDLAIKALEERPQGKWICDYRTCKCSVCNFTTVIDTYNFCFNCGADMRGKEE